MSNRRNYYRILHVQPEAPLPVIRSSYRAIMQKLKKHPDLGGNPIEAAILNEAYAVLSNPEKRAAYDAELSKAHSKSKLGGKYYHSRNKAKNTEAPNVAPREKPYQYKNSQQCLFCRAPHSQRSYHETDAACSHCDSPLSQANQIELEQSCRRAVNRITKNEKLHVYTDWPQAHTQVKLQDISPNGMSFTTSVPVEKSKIIKIASNIINAIAEVKSCQKSITSGQKMYSIGVRFLTLKFQKDKGTFIMEQV